MRGIALAALACALLACGNNTPNAQNECGDGVVGGGEACDLGADNGVFGVGCTTSCTFVCVDPATDCDAPLPCQIAMCTTDNICAFAADTGQDGMSCGTGQVCSNGACGSAGECGNGMVEGSEQCDWGAQNDEDVGCEPDCTLSCASAQDCDDSNPCNGAETCDGVTVGNQTGQKCNGGTSLDNGTSCGTNLICINASCGVGVCGDGFVAGTEECDDANNVVGDGCENDCTFSCVSTDAARDCTPADACAGQGTCNDTTHVCTAGTPLADDTACGNGDYCQSGVCEAPVCGDGNVTPDEECDEGAGSNGTANSPCKADCTWVCETANDCGTAPACNDYQCNNHLCQVVADPADNGMTCEQGTSKVCSNGSCVDPAAVCGNGVTETGEECDFGTGSNGPGTGCETNCQFSCDVNAQCENNNLCDGTETCSNVTVGGKAGKRCTTGTPPAQYTACGTGQLCNGSQQCVASVCGDGYIDSNNLESCEPPNTSTCDSQCRPKVCGDSIRADGEQCDDGNLTRLDGCDHTCKFEQIHRTTDLKIVFNIPNASYCSANALGGAASSIAQGIISDAIDEGIASGSITIMFQFLGLDDLSGTNDNAVSLGILGGAPLASPGAIHNGAMDLDWWYQTSLMTIDSNRVPTSQLSATITAKVLDVAGPADMAFTVDFVGTIVTMNLFGAKMRGTINATSTPLTSTGGSPGHLASENLDPALQSFANIGAGANASDRMLLCGNTTARSLDSTQLAQAVLNYCADWGYGPSNTLLDLFVGGCRTLGGLVNVISPTQPDRGRDGAQYRFQADANRNIVSCTRCTANCQTASNFVSHNLDSCLDNAGYSSQFRIRTGRVIAK